MSRGLLAWPEVDGNVTMGTSSVVTPAEDGSLSVTLQMRGPSWIEADGVVVLFKREAQRFSYLQGELVPYEDGPVVWNSIAQDENEPLNTSLTFRMEPEEDGYYIFILTGEVAPDFVSKIFGGNAYAMTNPLYVDVP